MAALYKSKINTKTIAYKQQKKKKNQQQQQQTNKQTTCDSTLIVTLPYSFSIQHLSCVIPLPY